MGSNLSREVFDDELAKAKLDRNHYSYDVSLGRDFTNPSTDARDPKCIWARFDGAPCCRIRLGRSYMVMDLITLYDADAAASRDSSTGPGNGDGETTYAVSHDERTERLVMERRTLGVVPRTEVAPSFADLKIYFGHLKWRLTPVFAEREGFALRSALFLVHEGSLKGGVDRRDIVGLIKVEDFLVKEFLLERSFSPILIGAVLYLLTRVYNGMVPLPTDKMFRPKRPIRITNGK